MTIDGEEAEAVRVDYILRGMALPAGEHTVVWSFRAPYWGVTETITAICSILVILSIIGAIIFNRRKEDEQ